MKTIHKFLRLFSFAILVVIIISSCSEDLGIADLKDDTRVLEIIPETQNTFATSIEVVDGMLSFQSLEDYRSTLIALSKMDANERQAWEAERGFQSMQSIFESILTEPNLSQRYLEEGLIIENPEFGVFELNIFNPAYAMVTNRNGHLRVKDDIYQFGPELLNVWENVEEGSQLDRDPSIQYSLQNTKLKSSLNDQFNWKAWNMAELKNCKAVIQGYFSSDYIDPNRPNVLFIRYFINVSAYTLDLKGNWSYDRSTKITIKGSSHSQLLVASRSGKLTRDFKNSYGQNTRGATSTIVPDEEGIHELPKGTTFVQPASLLESDWQTQVVFSNGNVLTTGIRR